MEPVKLEYSRSKFFNYRRPKLVLGNRWESNIVVNVQRKGCNVFPTMGSVGEIFLSIVRSLEYPMNHKLAINDWVLQVENHLYKILY